MKLKVKPILAAVLAAALSLAIALPAAASDAYYNLLGNGGFESTIDDCLSTWIGPNVKVTTEEHRSGNASALCQSETAGTGSILQQTCVVATLGTFQLSAYVKVKTAATTPALMVLRFRDKKSNVLNGVATKLPTVVTDTWVRVSVTMFAPAETSMVDSVFICASESGAFYLDDITLTRSNDAADMPKVENESFESSLSGWNQQGGGSIFTTTDETYLGTTSASFSYFQAEPFNSYLEQTIAAHPGSYDLTSYVKTAPSLSGVGAVFFLEALDANGKVLAFQATTGVNNSGGAWVPSALTLTAPAGTVQLRVKAGGLYCVGAFYVDNVVLTRTA